MDKAQVDLKFKDSKRVVIKNSADLSLATCWETDCRVDQCNSTHIELELFRLIDTEIYESGLDVNFPYPNKLAGLLIFFIKIFELWFYDHDKVDLGLSNDNYKFIY